MPRGVGERHGDLVGKKERGLHGTWRGIKERCEEVGYWAYKWYGGRGITLWKPWSDSYPQFKADILQTLGKRPSKQHSLDRINNNLGYVPGNLRWATHKEQARNRSNNKLSATKVIQIKHLVALGEPQAEVARRFNVHPSIISRVVNGKRWVA